MNNPGYLVVNAESRPHLATASPRHAQGAAIEILDNPLSLQRDFQKSGAERAADMRPALTPVNTGTREAAAQSPGRRDVDSEGFERPRSTFGDVICIVT